jgi:hypothetical protein
MFRIQPERSTKGRARQLQVESGKSYNWTLLNGCGKDKGTCI